MRHVWRFIEDGLTLMVVGFVRIVAGKEKALEIKRDL